MGSWEHFFSAPMQVCRGQLPSLKQQIQTDSLPGYFFHIAWINDVSGFRGALVAFLDYWVPLLVEKTPAPDTKIFLIYISLGLLRIQMKKFMLWCQNKNRQACSTWQTFWENNRFRLTLTTRWYYCSYHNVSVFDILAVSKELWQTSDTFLPVGSYLKSTKNFCVFKLRHAQKQERRRKFSTSDHERSI